MDIAALHDAITADPASKALADAGNDAGCAAAVAATLPPELFSTYLNERGIFASFTDPADAESVMQGLESAAQTNPVVARALKWLQPNNGGIDLSHAAVRTLLDQLQQAGVLRAAAVATLKSLAERTPIVTAAEVSAAWSAYRPGGRIAS